MIYTISPVLNGTAEHVDEEQLKPSTYGDDAWNHTIKYGYHHQEWRGERTDGEPFRLA